MACANALGRTGFAAAMAACLLFAPPAHAVTSSMSVGVRVMLPLIVIENDELDFGGVFANTPGSVTINPASGARTAAGGAVLLSATYSMGEFNVAGQPGAAVSISLPAGDVYLTNAGAGAQVRMHTMQYAVVGGGNTLDAAGSLDFRVGATVALAGTEPEGSYRGTYDVTVNYQ